MLLSFLLSFALASPFTQPYSLLVFLQFEAGPDENKLSRCNEVLLNETKPIHLNAKTAGYIVCQKSKYMIFFFFDNNILAFSWLNQYSFVYSSFLNLKIYMKLGKKTWIFVLKFNLRKPPAELKTVFSKYLCWWSWNCKFTNRCKKLNQKKWWHLNK